MRLPKGGDPDAQFLLGLESRKQFELTSNVKTSDEAQGWLLDAVVNGSYTAAFSHLSTLEYNQISRAIDVANTAPEIRLESAEFKQKLKQAYVWAKVSSMVGDHLGDRLLRGFRFS